MLLSDEESKGVQEVAKTTSKVLCVVESFGHFLGRIIGEPGEQVGGLLADKLRYMRVENAVRFKSKIEILVQGAAEGSLTKKLPLNVLCPLLDAATLEEDNSAQELWANLLVNGIDTDCEQEVTKGLVGVLRDLGQMEARCLETIVKAWGDKRQHADPFSCIPIYGLPNNVEGRHHFDLPNPPPDSVMIALHHLKRLGCIDVSSRTETYHPTFDAGVVPTILGETLVAVCSR